MQPHAAFGTVALHLDEVPLDLAMARQELYPEPGWNPVVQPGSLETDLLGATSRSMPWPSIWPQASCSIPMAAWRI